MTTLTRWRALLNLQLCKTKEVYVKRNGEWKCSEDGERRNYDVGRIKFVGYIRDGWIDE
jgi:hypothetical protein